MCHPEFLAIANIRDDCFMSAPLGQLLNQLIKKIYAYTSQRFVKKRILPLIFAIGKILSFHHETNNITAALDNMRALGKTFCLFLHLISFGLCAQNDPARFIHFSIADGLPSSGIRSLATDPEGFVWIGTLNGLARWDGHQIVAFSELAPNAGLPEDDIKLLFCDSHGFLWIKFLNTPGMFHINLATWQVSGYYQDFFHSREAFPPKALEDSNGDIWFATVKGLSRFSYPSQSFDFFPLTYKGLSSIVIQVCQTPDGKLWVSTGEGLFRFYPDTRQYERIPLYADDSFQHVIASDKEGHLWIGRWYDNQNGVVEYDPAKGRIVRSFSKKEEGSDNFHSTDLSHIYPDGDKIWFCCNEGGLCVFNKKNNQLYFTAIGFVQKFETGV